MIAYKGRDVKRGRKSNMARNIERLYKEGKCRECSVIVTRMDFAKILGKFTKVKIQYESVSSPKTKKVIPQESPPSDTRLKSNENGMVLIRRNAYQKHPINNSQFGNKKNSKLIESSTPSLNVLKENNGLKKTAVLKDRNSNYNSKPMHSNIKQYTIIFVDPKINTNIEQITSTKQISLADLIPVINKSILPSDDWIVEYLPKIEIKDDKVYDRIEAELEGLMFSEKAEEKPVEAKVEENKVDDFPSIMDILNDNYTVTDSKENDQSVIIEFKNNLESTDVEAMLLGKSNDVTKISEPTPMEVDSTVMSKLIEDVENINAVVSVDKNVDKSQQIVELSIKENPQSPSILDETLQKGIEEHIPAVPIPAERLFNEGNNNDSDKTQNTTEMDISAQNMSAMSCEPKLSDIHSSNRNVSHVIFKKITEGTCTKSVTCPTDLKYTIELEGKSVEFLGAPKYISSLEDLQVLLQIVNESGLDSLYVLQ